MQKDFDIIVVGGGHAGLEAAFAAAQFELKVALLSMPSVPLGSAPCNPCVGGVGKGQVTREIDALGGVMGKLADLAGIQYRVLNESKGHAVRSTRVQIDKELYPKFAHELVEENPFIEYIPEKVKSVTSLPEGYLVHGEGSWSYGTKKLIMTVGTFLNGKLHCGSEQTLGGRMEAEASSSLLDIFSQIKTVPARFKTGTPPRLRKDSINYDELEEQASDPLVRNFHWSHSPFDRKSQQVSCYLARTNPETLKIIRDNKESSPMYNGQIKAVGARYCPSIEDKAYRYPDKDNHHVFIEPEGLNLSTVYPSGISSSLPPEIQRNFVHTIKGLEEAEIARYGYAVEYDVVDTTELDLTLEHQLFPGLYFAGQVNGTSGYEEAAGQGLIAGANAALKLLSKEPLILSRRDSYIGVMIEDLVSNTRDEPYRLFTARSENRLYIREDNSIKRMWSYRTSLGLAHEIDGFQRVFLDSCALLEQFCDSHMIKRSDIIFEIEELSFYKSFEHTIAIKEILKSPELDPVIILEKILKQYDFVFSYDVINQVAIEKKYEGYIKRADKQYSKVAKLDQMKLNWEELINSENISFECKQRIQKIKPMTFAQLKIIEGIRPATLAVVASRSL
ncbi:MAG: tRNA uridine-5-carboxymethylaminomethyl(34) synthesis enzyme MnmG [Halobacteriovoraceae bacterium]|nr:tRNA uridine-5-carboxymethylaminomethyl(34) synthesis enzyme MnmG [Halobacteriovoraceae bacterium]